MRIRTILAVLTIAEGIPTTAAEVPVELAALIQQLESRDYKTRENAFAILKAKGPDTLPALKVALVANASPEVQRRLESIIEKQKIDQLTKATRVTVKANNQPIRLVLKDICKQAGYTLTESLGNTTKVSVDLQNVPFWEALEKATAGSGITTAFQDDERKMLHAYLGHQVNPYVDTAGPFRFTATNINSSRNLQLGNIPLRSGFQQQNEYLNVNVQFHAEPKAPVVSVGTTQIIDATDDFGGSLAPPKAEGQNLPETRFYNGGMYRSLNQTFSVNLARGDRRATMIKELTGKVNLMLLSDSRPEMEIDKVLEPGKKKGASDAVEIELTEFGEANAGYFAQVTLKSRKKTESEYGWWSSIYQRLELHDDQGRKYQANGIDEQNVTNNQVSMKLRYLPPDGAAVGKPRKLILMEWITIEKEFEFKFKDIPLP